jgi:hypothetical protein
MRYVISVISFAVVMSIFPVTLEAQTAYGSILGAVTDSSGGVVPNANVTVTNLGTNVSSEVKSNAEGNYNFPNLIPGKYQVTIEVPGFKKFVASDLVLLVDRELRVDAILQAGAVTSSVEVVARGQMVNTDSSAVSTVIENEEIADLPLITRNFMELAVLSPGTIVDNSGVLGNGVSYVRTSLSNSAIWIGGGRASSNGYMIDGVDNIDPGAQSPNISPPIDAIQEFTMMSKNYSAEFGGSASQINIAIKSGTNSLHGTAYDFLRNDALDATNFFAVKDPLTGKSKAQLRYNQFGFSLGGPIVLPKLLNGRNKLFFFGDYEGIRERTYTSEFGRYPSANELTGNFSADAPIYDPLTGQQFSGNMIPTSRVSTKTAQILGLGVFPTPNVPAQPGYNTVERLPGPNNVDQVTARVDDTISNRDTLYARLSYSIENVITPAISYLTGLSFKQQGWNAALSEIHLFSPHVVNDIRLAFNRPIAFDQQDGAFGKNLAGQLFTGVSTAPATFGLPNFGLTNYSGVGGSCCGPLDYTTNSISLVDGLTITRGKHMLKVGGSFRPFNYKEIESYGSRGLFDFTGQFTAGSANPSGNAIADFLLGLPFVAEVNQGLSTSWLHGESYSAYAQDDWKVSPRLTFNLGLRYEYNTPLYEQQNRISVVDFSYPGGRLLTPNKQIVDQLNSPLLGYTPLRGLYAPDYRNWAPRIGFAYRPFSGNNSTVVRAAYGIFYDSWIFNEDIFSVLNPPWASTYAAVGTLASPINEGGLFPIAPTAAPVAGTISSLTVNPTQRTPYVQQWNFDVERELAHDWLLDVGYEGSEATKLDDRSIPTQGQLMPNGSGVFHYPNFGYILLTNMDGKSNYNALTALIEKRFRHGYYFQAHYTWSKVLGIASAECGTGTDSCGGAQNYWNRNADYGPAAFDVTQRLVFSGIYELPFGRGKQFGSQMAPALDRVLGGWQLNSLYQVQSGYPFNIVATDASGMGQGGEARADLVGNPHAPDPVDPARVFNRYAFAQPKAGTFGDSGRNILRGKGLNNWDLSLFKNNHLTERFNMQFRAELFNAFNHTQLGPFPGYGFSLDPNSSFGVYLSTQHDARVIQLALRLIF